MDSRAACSPDVSYPERNFPNIDTLDCQFMPEGTQEWLLGLWEPGGRASHSPPSFLLPSPIVRNSGIGLQVVDVSSFAKEEASQIVFTGG